jgi:hypothetical protein
MVQGFLARPEAARVLLSFWARLESDRKVRARNARLYAGYRQRVAARLRRGAASGRLARVPPEAMAGVVVGVVLGIVLQAHFDPGFDAVAAAEEAASAVLARVAPNSRS